MKYSILGAGAMGSLFGGLLVARGHAVELLDINDAHLDSIRKDGLILDTDEGSQIVRPVASRPEAATLRPDWLIVFTKTLHTNVAMQSVRHLLGDRTQVYGEVLRIAKKHTMGTPQLNMISTLIRLIEVRSVANAS